MTSQSRGVPGTSLRELLAGLMDVVVPDVLVTDITLDSRKVVPGGAFIALPGLGSHGIQYVAQALSRGARVVLWQPTEDVQAPAATEQAVFVAIPDLSALVGTIADRCFGSPSSHVRVTGVTGTNGKTTTAYVLAAALAALGEPSAYAGTLGFGRIGAIEPGTHTTPDCVTLHRQVARLRETHTKHLAMEISSHALDQQRVAGLRIDTAVFTNLSRDHLDYHGTLQAYGAAKARLFAWPNLRHAVINIDAAFGSELAKSSTAAMLTVYGRSASYSSFFGQLTSGQQASSPQFVIATAVTPGPQGLTVEFDSSAGRATAHTRFVGDFNVDNMLAVLGVLLGSGVALDAAVRAIEQCVAPPGRMETFGGRGMALVIVDYAHTPDALEKALTAARRHCTGRLLCVFGCGGDRDAGKRPVMGEIAERLADVVIVTDDNPRTENGDAIVTQILAGLKSPANAGVERDRARAIKYAIGEARAGDAVLIAGKGHEDYQIVGVERRYFSDRAVVAQALNERGADGGGTSA